MIDIAENNEEVEYVTNAWFMCDKINQGSLVVRGKFNTIQDLKQQPENLSETYCRNFPSTSGVQCPIRNGIADCTGLSDTDIQAKKSLHKL